MLTRPPRRLSLPVTTTFTLSAPTDGSQRRKACREGGREGGRERERRREGGREVEREGGTERGRKREKERKKEGVSHYGALVHLTPLSKMAASVLVML